MKPSDLKSYTMAGYEEYRPPKRDYMIEAVWSQFTPLNAPAGGIHHLVPEPTVNIALSWRYNKSGNTTNQQVDLYGPIDRPFTFNLIPGHQLIAARIKPEWLPTLLGVSANDLLNTEMDLADVSPELCSRLQKLFIENLTTQEMIDKLYKTITEYAQHRLNRYALSPYGIRAIELIRRCGGKVRQSGLAQHLEISERQLRRTVESMIGITPKAFSRNIRFLKTLAYADYSEQVNWSDCAVSFGYFDQAHLINEFKTISRLTPIELMTSRKAESVFSNPT